MKRFGPKCHLLASRFKAPFCDRHPATDAKVVHFPRGVNHKVPRNRVGRRNLKHRRPANRLAVLRDYRSAVPHLFEILVFFFLSEIVRPSFVVI